MTINKNHDYTWIGLNREFWYIKNGRINNSVKYTYYRAIPFVLPLQPFSVIYPFDVRYFIIMCAPSTNSAQLHSDKSNMMKCSLKHLMYIEPSLRYTASVEYNLMGHRNFNRYRSLSPEIPDISFQFSAYATNEVWLYSLADYAPLCHFDRA